VTATVVHRRPRAIIFDWDNTLVDSWATIHEALNICMAAMGKPLWTIDDTREKVRLSLRDAFPLHFGERWEEARKVYMDAFQAIHLERLTPLPGRVQMLDDLAGEGIYLSVVSNKTGPVLRREAEQLGWSGRFGAIVGAGDCAADKPACDPVELALKPSGIAAGEHVWFVGDTAIDMECALNSGCLPVLLGGDATGSEFLRFPPRLSCADGPSLFRRVRGL
jgi:phosphoglycolate phosphatase